MHPTEIEKGLDEFRPQRRCRAKARRCLGDEAAKVRVREHLLREAPDRITPARPSRDREAEAAQEVEDIPERQSFWIGGFPVEERGSPLACDQKIPRARIAVLKDERKARFAAGDSRNLVCEKTAVDGVDTVQLCKAREQGLEPGGDTG